MTRTARGKRLKVRVALGAWYRMAKKEVGMDQGVYRVITRSGDNLPQSVLVQDENRCVLCDSDEVEDMLYTLSSVV